MHSKTQTILSPMERFSIRATLTFLIRINAFNIFPVFSAESHLQGQLLWDFFLPRHAQVSFPFHPLNSVSNNYQPYNALFRLLAPRKEDTLPHQALQGQLSLPPCGSPPSSSLLQGFSDNKRVRVYFTPFLTPSAFKGVQGMIFHRFCAPLHGAGQRLAPRLGAHGGEPAAREALRGRSRDAGGIQPIEGPG